MKHQLSEEVGRAIVPADTGRHGGRPYAIKDLERFFLD
jgi:hypothetical protein